MPLGSLKKSVPLGAASTASTPLGLSNATNWSITLSRPALRTSRLILPSFQAPKKRSPSAAGPRPHPWQNAAPVGAMVGVYFTSGWSGLGPLVLVPGQFDPPPQP